MRTLVVLGGTVGSCYLSDKWFRWRGKGEEFDPNDHVKEAKDLCTADRREARRQEEEVAKKELDGLISGVKDSLKEDDKHLQKQISDLRAGLKHMREEAREEKDQQQDEMMKVKADIKSIDDYHNRWEDRMAGLRASWERNMKKLEGSTFATEE